MFLNFEVQIFKYLSVDILICKRNVLFLFEVEQKLVYRSPASMPSVMAKQSNTGADLTLYTPYTPS
jgi:hypothetical protein